jgi:hypothetical protein
MIYIDIDGVLVDFYGTAKKFGIELELNVFGEWRWGAERAEAQFCDELARYPTAEQFYTVAEPQPWVEMLLANLSNHNPIAFLTKDHSKPKRLFLFGKLGFGDLLIFETGSNKSIHCDYPCDLLIDDNEAECEAWREKGGIAYWFNLAEQDPFGKFLEWWELKA